MEVQKDYTYLRDGKKVCIRRKWTNKGTRHIQNDELDEYFKNNADDIKNSKRLQEVLETYNSTHDNKISLSLLYKKYKTVFGLRKNHNKPNNKNEEEDKSESNEEEQKP